MVLVLLLAGLLSGTPAMNNSAGHFSNISTTGNVTAGGNVTVGGTETVTGTLTANGNVTVAGRLGVTGNLTANSNVSVIGALIANANETVAGTLGVTGVSTFGSSISAPGGSTNLTLGGVLALTGAGAASTTLTCVNDASFGTIHVTGAATQGSAVITGAATVGTTLGVTGVSTLGVTNTGALTSTTGHLTSNATLDANATVAGTLGVTGASTLGVTGTGALTSTTGHFTGAVTHDSTSSYGDALTFSNAAPTFNASSPTTSLLTYNNNGVTVATLDKGGYTLKASGHPSTYYVENDLDGPYVAGDFIQNGSNGYGLNSISTPLVTASNFGIIYCQTTSTTAGCYFGFINHYPIVASASVTYQWQETFYLPAASTGANRYTAYIGAFNGTGTANNANAGPLAGPYVAYSDNLNSGNWVMGSAVANVRTTGNSATAAGANAWHNLTITLANGTYTYVVDGVTIGTLADANIAASPVLNQTACLGGIEILPDGTNFTTARTLMLDRSTFYATGLTR